MNIFEFMFFAGLLAFVIFASKALGNVFGITAWIFAIPIVLLLVLTFRWLSKWLRGRRLGKSIFDRKKKNDEN